MWRDHSESASEHQALVSRLTEQLAETEGNYRQAKGVKASLEAELAAAQVLTLSPLPLPCPYPCPYPYPPTRSLTLSPTLTLTLTRSPTRRWSSVSAAGWSAPPSLTSNPHPNP